MVLDVLKTIDDEDRLLALIEQGSDSDGAVFGRKKLIKLVFFAKYLDLDKNRLTPDSKFGDFDFIIYNYGPFSYDVMNSFDELKEEGLIKEERGRMGYNIKLTEKGEEKAKKAEKKMEKEELNRIRRIAEEFADYNGGSLERKSLKYLEITKDDKDDLAGTPVEVVITEGVN